MAYMRKSASIIGIALGLLLMLAAGGVRWFVAPALAVLPGNTDTTRNYTGTAALLLNPSALTSPAAGDLLVRNAPITVAHHTKALGTKGGSALVSDAAVITAGGKPVASVDHHYAVDRSDLGRGSGYGGVVKQTGLTFNWPIHTRKQNYVGWVADTGKTTPLRFTGAAKRGGVSTYVFTTAAAAAPITDPLVLKALPQSLPKSTVAQLAAGLNLTPAQLSTFRAVLPSLPDPVPFSYTYQVSATYWVAPASGIVVDVTQHEVRTLNLSLGGAAVPVTPVMDITFRSSPSTLKAAATDARDKGKAIHRIYRTVPLGLLVVGAVLFLLGLVGVLLGRRQQARSKVR
ncbi:MAG: hypothetical protein DLM59_17245 [Pseudonocardiales bacterium]|nr:MAG: hypothetical protein DLM59_17245 [Pseudonocardiales bacterium]